MTATANGQLMTPGTSASTPVKPGWASLKASTLREFSPARKDGSQNRKNHQIGSVMNLPKKNAQVCRKVSSLNQETFACATSAFSASCSSTSLWMKLYSACESLPVWSFAEGEAYSAYQNASQVRPTAPVRMNAHSQLQALAM